MSDKILNLINNNLEVAYENLKLSKHWKKKFKTECTGKSMIENDLKNIEFLNRVKEKYNQVFFEGKSLR